MGDAGSELAFQWNNLLSVLFDNSIFTSPLFWRLYATVMLCAILYGMIAGIVSNKRKINLVKQNKELTVTVTNNFWPGFFTGCFVLWLISFT